MRLTDENKLDFQQIKQRIISLRHQYMGYDTPLRELPSRAALLKFRHGGELESYKIKLENFILDTDVKEKAQREFINCQ